MIQTARLKPYCQIGLWLVLLLVIVNLTLTGLTDTPVLAWLPETVTGTGFLEETRRRVVQAVQEYRLGRVGRDDHLGVFVGISNMREGIELSVISETIGSDWRFLGVGGAGLGMGDFVRYADLVLESDLKPDVAILGFGLHQLVDARPRPAGAVSGGFISDVRRGDVRSAIIRVRNAAWVYSRRQDVSVTVDTATLNLRARLLDRFGVPVPQSEAEKLSPWREMVRSDWPDHFSAATLSAMEKMLADRGVFDAQTYEKSPKAFSSMMTIIERFRRQNTKVILLLMPEGSIVQKRVPSEALDAFRRELQSRFPGDLPPILDYRQAVNDEGFVDIVHLNRFGRLEFSRELAGAIRELLPSGAPLMARQARAAE